jgi:hypothetical protein
MRPNEASQASLAELQARLSRALFETHVPAPAGLLRARRFSVHRNNLYASLGDALRARYPVIERLVGEDFFKAAASLFIEAHPPASPVLIEYGQAFPAFLEDFEPARALPYLAGVARLEWLRHSAYHAADRLPLSAAELAGVRPGQAGCLILKFHPSAALIASPYPIVSIWETNAYDAEVRPIGPDLPGEAALVIRPELEVSVLRLDAASYAFAAALAAGEALERSAEKAAVHSGFDLGHVLAKLIAAGAFCGFAVHPNQAGGPRHVQPSR